MSGWGGVGRENVSGEEALEQQWRAQRKGLESLREALGEAAQQCWGFDCVTWLHGDTS